MRIIIKSILSGRKNIRYFAMFSIFLISLFTIITIKKSVDIKIYTEENQEEYLTVYVKPTDENSISEIENLNITKKITKEEDTYILLFNEYDDVKLFIKDYENLYESIFYNEYTISNVMKTLNTVLTIIVYIFIIIIITLLILNITEIILSQKENISFYKMLGFKNKNICKYLLLTLTSVYTIIYIMSILFTSILSTIVKKMFNEYNLNIEFLQIKSIAGIYLLMISIIIVIVYILYTRIRKISPIKFRTNN